MLVSEQQRHLTGNDSPYLVAKSMLMSEGIPVQVFRLEKMARPDLAHLLNTMSVACYAKLTGTPYVIKTVAHPMAQELVIGIGSAHVSPNRMQAGSAGSHGEHGEINNWPPPPHIPGEWGVDRRSRAVGRWLWDGRVT